MQFLKNLFAKDSPLIKASTNMGLVLFFGWLINFLALALVNVSDQFHNIEHLAFGVFIGTFVYNLLGKDRKAIVLAVLAGALFTVPWEFFEIMLAMSGRIPLDSRLESILDSAFLMVGTVVGVIIDKLRSKKR